ncbi:angiopoietin-related protein 2-like [Haliotis cracherodii]|uniref:angiopoietin-related protein 2-like n=1 Tax=Haliotis cracherodii TaxID=6455 RepID=UPI0039EB0B23
MKHLQTYLLLIVVSSGLILAKRRRISFMNCQSAKSIRNLATTTTALTKIECSVICLNDPECLSASFCKADGGYTCQLSRFYADGGCSQFAADGDCSLTAIVNPCENGGTFFPQNRTCQCVDGFVGDYCQRRYRDCTETPQSKHSFIQPLESDYISEIYCEYHPLHLKRLTPITTYMLTFSGNFTRTWQSMRQGIPLQSHYYFLGLENLHQLTKQGVYDLWVFLMDVGKSAGSIRYTNICVDSEAEGYALHWDHIESENFGSYDDNPYMDGFGGVGDVTKNINGARFGTYDNDVNGCAGSKGAGWWYNPLGCTMLQFDPDGLSWPVNRTGAVEIEQINIVKLVLLPVYWYVEDDLVL